jgi:hypothetical protein
MLALGAAIVHGPAGGQSPPPDDLADRYARFLGAAAARRYLEDLPFEIGGSREQAVTLRSRGQAYRVELVALDAADDCEACAGQVDALVFRDGAPVLLEKGVFDGGSHGRAYAGDRTAVLPLARDTDGLVITGEMWAPRGCRVFTAHVFAVDADARALRKVFERAEESCEGGPVVRRLTLESRGLDGQGRGRFALTTVRREGRREVKAAETLRFDPARWALVAP